MRSSSGTSSAAALLVVLSLVAAAVAASTSAQQQQPSQRRIRTTWPTETGTMVRILKKRAGSGAYGGTDAGTMVRILKRSGYDSSDIGTMVRVLKRAMGYLDFARLTPEKVRALQRDNQLQKRDLFLRTSRSSGIEDEDEDEDILGDLEEVVSKRSSAPGLAGQSSSGFWASLLQAARKRDSKAKVENPIFFRASRALAADDI